MNIRTVTASLAALLFMSAQANAQPPPSAASPNFLRAYRHFVNSPYTYKEISAPRPGYLDINESPYARETFHVEPGHYLERVTPYSFESHEYVPGYRGSLDTPFGGEGYHVPGYGRSYVQPLPPPYRR